MINKKKAKAYELTESSRQLANFLTGVTVDEKKKILWSEQDLRLLGINSLKPLKFLDFKLHPLRFPLVLLFFLLGLLLAIWDFCLLLLIEIWESALKKNQEKNY